jgi:hypothetical protein
MDMDKPLRYPICLYYLQRLGMMAGFPEIFDPCYTRHGTGEGVQGMFFKPWFISHISYLNTANLMLC